jgi:ABC-type protease/lipase transport system fused ATPase/permease subunit
MTAHAEDELKPVDFCTDLSLVANQVMKARQQDRPMSETLPMAKNRIKSWGDKYGLEMDMDEAEEMAAEMVMIASRKFRVVLGH